LVKLVIEERESTALMAYLADRGPIYSSRVAAVELRRAVRRHNERTADDQAELILATLRLIELDDELARDAGLLQPPALRTLDAVHVAAALALENECEALVSYDDRLNTAAHAAGLEVRSPA
jgi:predicted nucleic acid-binding protein